MIVLLDVDGVICNFVGFYIRLAEEAGALPRGRFDPLWEPPVWDIDEALELNADQKFDVTRALNGGVRDAHAKLMDPYPGAIEGVKRLRYYADVWFVTAPYSKCPTWDHDRRQWFLRRLPGAERRLIGADDKRLVYGDLFVEDKPENCYAWLDQWPSKHALLWGRRYNKAHKPVEGLTRVAARWDALLERVTAK